MQKITNLLNSLKKSSTFWLYLAFGYSALTFLFLTAKWRTADMLFAAITAVEFIVLVPARVSAKTDPKKLNLFRAIFIFMHTLTAMTASALFHANLIYCVAMGPIISSALTAWRMPDLWLSFVAISGLFAYQLSLVPNPAEHLVLSLGYMFLSFGFLRSHYYSQAIFVPSFGSVLKQKIMFFFVFSVFFLAVSFSISVTTKNFLHWNFFGKDYLTQRYINNQDASWYDKLKNAQAPYSGGYPYYENGPSDGGQNSGSSQSNSSNNKKIGLDLLPGDPLMPHAFWLILLMFLFKRVRGYARIRLDRLWLSSILTYRTKSVDKNMDFLMSAMSRFFEYKGISKRPYESWEEFSARMPSAVPPAVQKDVYLFGDYTSKFFHDPSVAGQKFELIEQCAHIYTQNIFKMPRVTTKESKLKSIVDVVDDIL